MIGNERGTVILEFEVECLERFVALLNESELKRDGKVIKVTIDEYKPGFAALVGNLEFETQT